MGLAVCRPVGVGRVFAGPDFIAAGASCLFVDQRDAGHHRASQPAAEFICCGFCDLYSGCVYRFLGRDARVAIGYRNRARAGFSNDSIGARGALIKAFRFQHLERQLFIYLDIWLRAILTGIGASAIGPR